MRYYVIINGINSLTIPGLAIKDLPPISKTLMRNQKETIDGRDGDIITELGYSAYDKALTIGLYGSYDINDIIAFFNQKGTIVFSDEPDKYYNFTILDQIDYDKLVKFRTATIRIHCQPFKYPVSETPVEIEAEYVTAQGEDITLNNTGVAPLEIDLKGNTSQEGTPTPDNPQEVQVVTGDNTIKVCNENIQDNDWAVGRYDGSATSTNVHLKITNGTIYQEGHTYTIQFKSTNSNYSGKTIYLQNSNNQVNMGGITYDSTKEVYYLTKTLSSSEIAILRGSQVRLAVYVSQGVTTGDITNGMIFEGNTPTTDYIAHQEQEYEINLGTLELCKISTYQDYLYKSGENWYKHTEIGKVVLDGSADESWAYRNDYSAFYIDNTTSKGTIAPISNYFKGITSGISSNDNAILFNAFTLYLIYHALNGVVSDLRTWLSTHNTIVYYQLATPTEEQITNAELIEQLNAILNAVSYEDQTNISQENDNMPFILDVSALQKGTNEAIIDNEGNIYSKPIINIVGDGIVGVSLNGSQILSLDMTTYNDITIDTETMEAYDPNTSQLRNRQVTGDYSKFALQPGNNTIKVTGDFTSVIISKYKRWL